MGGRGGDRPSLTNWKQIPRNENLTEIACRSDKTAARLLEEEKQTASV